MRGLSGWAVIGLAAVAVLVVAAAVLPRVLDSPSASQPPSQVEAENSPSPLASSPGNASSASPIASASDQAAALPVWPVTPMPNPVPGAYRGGTPNDLVAGGPGFVAVGHVAPCCTGPMPDSDLNQSLVWTSQDGVAWDLVPDLASFGRSGLIAVANDDRGTMVAIGYDVLPPDEPEPPGLYPGTVWESGNGVDWVAVQGVEGTFRDVAWTGTEWVIVGELDGRAAAFVSPDLASWSTVILGGYGSSADLLTVRDDGRMLAVGCVDDTADPLCDGATWVSDDASSWEQRQLEASRVEAAASWDGGFVVAGGDLEDAQRRTWVSADGLEWVAGRDLGETNARIDTIAVVDGRLIAGGAAALTEFTLPHLWQSFDGLGWEPLAVPARIDGQVDGEIRALLPVGDRVIALGEAFVNPAEAAVGGAGPYVWIGEP